MYAIDCRNMMTQGAAQMSFSVRNEVDTTDAGHTKTNAVLVNMQDTEVPRDDTKPFTFGHATW